MIELEKAPSKIHKPFVVWLTGLSSAGKTTIGNLLKSQLVGLGYRSVLLDGDMLRKGLNRDLGFTDSDRVENVRRVAEVARLMSDAGLITIVALISPFSADRDLARSLMNPEGFAEVHIDASIELAESRDVKGLYLKARRGELSHFTGIDSPYEVPLRPDLKIDTGRCTPNEATKELINLLVALGVIL